MRKIGMTTSWRDGPRQRRWGGVGVLALLAIVGALQACGGGGGGSSDNGLTLSPDWQVPAYDGPVTEIPDDLEALIYAHTAYSGGDIVLYVQGGPLSVLVQPEELNAKGMGLQDLTQWSVHEANTLNTSLLATPDLPYARAFRENDVSVEMLYRVVSRLAQLNRRVHLVGQSFGAFLLQLAVARHPDLLTMTENIVIMNGRLDVPAQVWRWARDGVDMEFVDGVIAKAKAVQPTRDRPDIVDEDTGVPMYVRSALKLQAAIARIRFTAALPHSGLEKIIYVYATRDEAVGTLSGAEIAFLKRAGAVLYCVQDGGHTGAFNQPYAAEIGALIRGTSKVTRSCV